MAVFSVVSVGILAAVYRPLLLGSVSPTWPPPGESASALVGMAFMLALAVAVGLSSLAIGAILSTALLIGPAATALRLDHAAGLAPWPSPGSSAWRTTWLGVLLAYDSADWAGHDALAGQLLHRGPRLRRLPRLGGAVLRYRPRAAPRAAPPPAAEPGVGPPHRLIEERHSMFSGFMTNAWIVATMVAVIAGVVGFFVVLRGAAFPAHAIPNGAFAGAAGAALVGVNALVGLGVFAVLAALEHRHGSAGGAVTTS